MTIAISGGGIGGLSLAIALQRKDFDVKVYESAPILKPLGAGIVLAANAVKALVDIGIGEEVLQAGRVIRKLRIKSKQGNILSEVDAEEVNARFGYVNNFAIHRADLHQVLISLLNPGSLITNKECIDFKQNNHGIAINFSDGTEAHADYLIACDGIHSAIRKKLVPDSTPRYAGYTCWRAVIDNPPNGFNVEETTETWGRNGRFGIVPLTNGRVYWFACINTSENNPVMQSYTPGHLLNHFKNFHNPVAEIIQSTRNDQLIWNDILDIKPLKKFAFGKIVLLGDAAHATTPNMGQGACMAIEDAAVLSNCIASTKDVEKAFLNYEEKRIVRTTSIVNRSWQMGKIAQLANPLLIALRNAAFRVTPPKAVQKQMEFLYDVSLY